MMTTKKRKTWKQKLTKKQLRHVSETTQRCTLQELKANIKRHRELCTIPVCFECEDIARRLGI